MKRDREELRKKTLKTKWDDLRRRGLMPPKNAEEAKQRLRDAHGY